MDFVCITYFVCNFVAKRIMPKKATDIKVCAAVKAVEPYLKKAYFDRLSEKVTETAAIGAILIRGLPEDDDEDDDEEDEEAESGKEEKPLTKDQVDSLRHVMMTKNRKKMLEQAGKEITGGQAGDYCMMFDTNSGNQAIYSILELTEKAMKKKSLPDKFDAMFGLTMNMDRYDFWIQDNELYGEGGNHCSCLLFLFLIFVRIKFTCAFS